MWCMTYELFCIFFGCMLGVLIPLGLAFVDLYRQWKLTLRHKPVSSDHQTNRLITWLFRFAATFVISTIMVWFFWVAFFELYKARCGDWMVN